MNAVISDADTLEVFTAAAEQQGGPVVMLNLLKFKEGGGALEYATYGAVARKLIGGRASGSWARANRSHGDDAGERARLTP